MTELLAKVLEQLSELPPERQDDIAHKLLIDLSGETPRTHGRAQPPSDAEALNDACRHGWLTPPRVVSGDPPPRLPVAPLHQLLAELQADRDDR